MDEHSRQQGIQHHWLSLSHSDVLVRLLETEVEEAGRHRQ